MNLNKLLGSYSKYRKMAPSVIDKSQFSGLRQKPVGVKYDVDRDPPKITYDDYDEKIDGGVKFDPEIHLNYKPAHKRLTMEELGLNDGTELSPIGATVPFTLFSEQATRIMRHEVMNPKVWQKYAHSSSIQRCIVRGYVHEFAPFTYAAWNHPKTLEIISNEAGIELEVILDVEKGSVNFAAADAKDDTPVIGWHYDSYHFVCVTMLSDTTGMIGGETVFNNHKTGDLCRIPDPVKGSSIILQGKYIEHQALKPQGGAERITMVTSFIPKNRMLHDESTLATTACISNCNHLFQEWCCYRFDSIIYRLNYMKKELEDARNRGEKFNLEKIKAFLKLQQDYLEFTVSDMEDNKQYLETSL